MAAASSAAVLLETPIDGENEQEPSVLSRPCRPKLVLGRFSRSFRLWRRTFLEASMHRRLQQLRPLFAEDQETVLLEDPSRTAVAVRAGHRIREEASAVARPEPHGPRLEMQFEVLVQLGHRLSVANFEILHLLAALREP